MVLSSLTMLLVVLLLTFGGVRSNATAGAVEKNPATAPASAVQVPQRPWTAIGSTGAVDEAALSIYAVNGAELGFKTPSAGTVITARYNVTNTFDNNANANLPGWTMLEMGSNAPLNCINSATLYRVKICSRDPVAICTARNRSSDHPCATCQFANNAVDFGGYLYYVEVTLDRTGAPQAAPTVYTLRLY
jgi:hypothetical protein